MRGGCFAASMEYVRDAFAWELAVVVLGDQCTSSAVHPAWSHNLLCWQAAPLKRMTMSSGPLHLADSTIRRLTLLAAAARYHLPGLDN